MGNSGVRWSWNAPTASSGEILKIFYVYSLEDSPPHYVLMVQFRNGQSKRLSQLKKDSFRQRFDREAIEMAQQQEDSIPVPLTLSKESVDSKGCCLM